MATTTNYSWTTPDDTDLVKDGAAAIRTLGSSADTTVKNLNPGTTAGDIDYYTTSTAKARIAIGTAGQILQVNSGATAPEWATPAGGGDFTHIATTTFSASAAVNVNDVFSTTYANYIVRTDFVGSGTVQMSMRLRVSGSDNTTSDYNREVITAYSTTIEAARSANQSSFLLGPASAAGSYVEFKFFNPFETAKTGLIMESVDYAGSSIELTRTSFAFAAATSFTGFSLIPASGDITGTLRVYGMANS